MLNTIKSLVAKAWKNEKANLEPGRHYIEEEFLVRISGSVEQRPDEFAAPTVSIPLIPALALFWEKAGIARGPALQMLRQALLEAMDKDTKDEDTKDDEKADKDKDSDGNAEANKDDAKKDDAKAKKGDEK